MVEPKNQEKSPVSVTPFLDLRLEYHNLQLQINDAILNVMESGRYVLGERVALFEQQFAEFAGALYGVGVGSGTEALHLALLACGIQPGDEVITVPFTAASTVLAISAAGGHPVFVDVESTYTLNVAQLERSITSRTRAIVPVHLFGYPADLDPILEIGRRNNLHVIEDACQAHGTEYKNRRVGSFGTMGCFSFYPTKNLGAYGDGGMIVTNDHNHYKRLLLLRNLGQNDRFSHMIQGFNSRLDELQAAVLTVKLQFLPAMNNKRAQLAQTYREKLRNQPIELPVESDHAKPNYHLFVIRNLERNQLKKFLEARRIETDIHYPTPIHLQAAYSGLGLRQGSFPVAEKYSQEVLSLPLNPMMTPAVVAAIADNVLDFLTR